jgi:hypothetical protein
VVSQKRTPQEEKVTASLMTAEQARAYRAAHDQAARELTRMSKRALLALQAVRDRAAGWTRHGSPQMSKHELVCELLDREYPVTKINEAGHVMYHKAGIGGSSACEWCHPHGGGRCDCSEGKAERERAAARGQS